MYVVCAYTHPHIQTSTLSYIRHSLNVAEGDCLLVIIIRVGRMEAKLQHDKQCQGGEDLEVTTNTHHLLIQKSLIVREK